MRREDFQPSAGTPARASRDAPAGGAIDAGIVSTEAVEAIVEAQAVRMFLDGLPVGLGSGYFGLATLAGLLLLYGAPAGLWWWMAWIAGVLTLGFIFYFRYRSASVSVAGTMRWGRRFVWIASLSGAGWGGAALLFLPARPEIEVAVLITALVVVNGGVGHMAAYLPVYLGFLTSAVLAMVLAFVRLGDPLHLGLALAMLGMYAGLVEFARQINRSIKNSLRLAHENAALAQALRLRSTEAEAANLAKSRFLAAASHDLRQPLHSLGLLLEVLRGQSLSAAQTETVSRLSRSVDTLDGLFDGLMDISRLDAEVVSSEILAMPLAPMFEELALEFAPLARERGLDLRVRASSLSVLSDRWLLERILRNLVANALRYTERGGVLLAARRRGASIAIEIWDSGIGIPLEQQTLVFEEFYQIGNPERDRSRGTGLGLAIVKRLCRSLDHRLELHSCTGRGTCFRVWLAEPSRTAAVAPTQVASNMVPVSLAGTVIMLVDDDVDVRDAMSNLLSDWGCRVHAYDSFAGACEGARHLEQIPELLIADYRLPGTRTGLDVLQQVREEFNCCIPALIITGDIEVPRQDRERLGQTQALTKPVMPWTLRQAIGAALVGGAKARELVE